MKPALSWAAQAAIYHIVIDRFAKAGGPFPSDRGEGYDKALTQWMGGTIAGIMRSLDYLESLGINTLVLTPFFKGRKYHGYWVTDYYDVDRHFGTKNDLAALVDELHGRAMHILFDLPITHCHYSAPAAVNASRHKGSSSYQDWFLYDDSGRFIGFFGDRRLPEFDLDNAELRNEIKRIIDYWLDFGFDGIRFDHAKRPSPSFWSDIRNHIVTRRPEVFLLGENWHETGAVGTLSPYLHGELNIPLSGALREFISRPGGKAVRNIITCVQSQEKLLRQGYIMPTYLDSHDVERACHLAGGKSDLLRSCYLLQVTLPYPPIIYYGSERGQGQTRNFLKGVCERDRFFREPMNWEGDHELSSCVADLLTLRKQYRNVILSGAPSFDTSREGLLSYTYSSGMEQLRIVINYGEKPKTIGLEDGTLHVIMSTTKCSPTSSAVRSSVTLQEYEGVILSTQRMGDPRNNGPGLSGMSMGFCAEIRAS